MMQCSGCNNKVTINVSWCISWKIEFELKIIQAYLFTSPFGITVTTLLSFCISLYEKHWNNQPQPTIKTFTND